MMAEDDFSLDSRELRLECDARGVVRSADAVAQRLLGARAGTALEALAISGTDEKVRALVREAIEHEVRDWELSLVVEGAPRTVSFTARPSPQGFRLLGFVMPEAYGATVAQLNDAMSEVLELNRRTARQKHELTAQKGALERAHRELEESFRGIRALHAELADKAGTLERNAEVKSRIVASVSHEFRTPLHAILGLTQLLESGPDPLTSEQTKQVGFIRQSAKELSEMVNDMLDLSKAEAGKTIVHPETFSLGDFLSAMRGMLRPLLPEGTDRLQLVVDAPAQDQPLHTDPAKLAQILRNLVSNALKFTKTGEVRVTPSIEADGRLTLRVRDTGAGIPPEHHERIFEEFAQVDSVLQRGLKGTGLGLPLSRRLAEVLGGELVLERSAPGEGSTFRVTLPAVHRDVDELRQLEQRPRQPGRPTVLVVEDDASVIASYDRYLALSGFDVVPAVSLEAARAAIAKERPVAIVLDIVLEHELTWEFLAELKRNPETADIPVLVVTVTQKGDKARALGADEFWLKPVSREQLLKRLRAAAGPKPEADLLVIDDDEMSRYIVRKLLDGSPYRLLEADTGASGVVAARKHAPAAILLDFHLEGETTAFDVLDELKSDARTRQIPVIIITADSLEETQRARLAACTEAVLSKGQISRELALNRIRDALAKAR